MPKMDWIIEFCGNGVVCETCGKVEEGFPDYICNAHTHGMEKYNHLDFQMVIHTNPNTLCYMLNLLCYRVQQGERFKAGDMVEGIFVDYLIRLDAFEEDGRTVLRAIIPDSRNRFPEDSTCDYPYSYQLVPTDELKRTGGGVVHEF